MLLRYALMEVRIYHEVINNLKQVLANLELELSSTRKEADEYHKVAIEKNADISGLETKVINLFKNLDTSFDYNYNLIKKDQ